ncbi:MAG: hypothetical protein GY856_25900 [bacterium]|nr:hypothetical protein [bacterium]
MSEPAKLDPPRPWQLLLLSAKTEGALGTATGELAAYLKGRPDLHLADVAYTLQVGRRDLGHRRSPGKSGTSGFSAIAARG